MNLDFYMHEFRFLQYCLGLEFEVRPGIRLRVQGQLGRGDIFQKQNQKILKKSKFIHLEIFCRNFFSFIQKFFVEIFFHVFRNFLQKFFTEIFFHVLRNFSQKFFCRNFFSSIQKFFTEIFLSYFKKSKKQHARHNKGRKGQDQG